MIVPSTTRSSAAWKSAASSQKRSAAAFAFDSIPSLCHTAPTSTDEVARAAFRRRGRLGPADSVVHNGSLIPPGVNAWEGDAAPPDETDSGYRHRAGRDGRFLRQLRRRGGHRIRRGRTAAGPVPQPARHPDRLSARAGARRGVQPHRRGRAIRFRDRPFLRPFGRRPGADHRDTSRWSLRGQPVAARRHGRRQRHLPGIRRHRRGRCGLCRPPFDRRRGAARHQPRDHHVGSRHLRHRVVE